MLAKHRADLLTDFATQADRREDIELRARVRTDSEMRTADRRDAAAHLLSRGFRRRTLLGGLAGGLLLPAMASAQMVFPGNPPQRFVPKPSARMVVKWLNSTYGSAASGFSFHSTIQVPSGTWAVRIVYFNDVTTATATINGAAVCPTATALSATPSGTDIDGNTVTAATFQQATFNNGGSAAFTPYNQPGGTTYTATIPANTQTANQPSLYFSGWMLVTPVPRTDGGNGNLICVRTFAGAGLRGQGNGNVNNGTINAGFPVAAGVSYPCWQAGSNTTVSPFGPMTATTNASPLYAIECLTDSPGRNILQVGDSIFLSLITTGGNCGPGVYAAQQLTQATSPVTLFNESYSGRFPSDFTTNALNDMKYWSFQAMVVQG
jgi:hypothetical protein